MLSNQDTNGEGTHTREGMAFKTNTKEIPMEPENRTLPKMGRGGELKAEKSAGGVQSVDQHTRHGTHKRECFSCGKAAWIC